MPIPPGMPGPTQVDTELEGVLRGPDLADAVSNRRTIRQPMAMAPTYAPAPSKWDDALIMRWADFQVRHPEWAGDYWQECRALYGGGRRLLSNDKLLERVFPRQLHEDPGVYSARKARAHYFPYAGTIIDHLLAGLGTDQLKISFDIIDPATGVATKPKNADWWSRWVEDVTDEAERPADYGLGDDDDEDDDEGGASMHDFLVDALREALQTQSAWVLADLPAQDPDAASAIDSKLAAEQSGLYDPYLCLVPSEQVIDWEADERGKLVWAMIMTTSTPRPAPNARRGIIRHTYVVWTDATWTRYEIDVDPVRPPAPEAAFRPADVGEHGFGRVPIERLVLPDGLYAMGKMHSLAREHFNKRCAMSWAEYKSLFSVLYEYLAPEEKNGLPVAEAQTDANRATNQIRGQGYTQIRGNEDKAEYVGPKPETFTAARESCNDAMREMHRVMYSMAMSANMDAAALSRSAESKDKDAATTEVLLTAFARIVRKFCRRMLVLAAVGRQEAPPKPTITGLQKFDVAGVDVKIAEAVQLFAGVPMLSPLIKELYLARFYGEIVGDLTQEQTETVRQQIQDALSLEEMAAAALAGMGSGAPAPDDGGDDDEDGGGANDGGGQPGATPAPPNKPGTSRSMFKSTPSKR